MHVHLTAQACIHITSWHTTLVPLLLPTKKTPSLFLSSPTSFASSYFSAHLPASTADDTQVQSQLCGTGNPVGPASRVGKRSRGARKTPAGIRRLGNHPLGESASSSSPARESVTDLEIPYPKRRKTGGKVSGPKTSKTAVASSPLSAIPIWWSYTSTT